VGISNLNQKLKRKRRYKTPASYHLKQKQQISGISKFWAIDTLIIERFDGEKFVREIHAAYRQYVSTLTLVGMHAFAKVSI